MLPAHNFYLFKTQHVLRDKVVLMSIWTGVVFRWNYDMRFFLCREYDIDSHLYVHHSISLSEFRLSLRLYKWYPHLTIFERVIWFCSCIMIYYVYIASPSIHVLLISYARRIEDINEYIPFHKTCNWIISFRNIYYTQRTYPAQL